MTERNLSEMGFTEVIQQPESFGANCERRGRLNYLSGYLSRIALLNYVPETCLNYRMSLPSSIHITGQQPLPCELGVTTLGGDRREQKEEEACSQGAGMEAASQEG